MPVTNEVLTMKILITEPVSFTQADSPVVATVSSEQGSANEQETALGGQTSNIALTTSLKTRTIRILEFLEDVTMITKTSTETDTTVHECSVSVTSQPS